MKYEPINNLTYKQGTTGKEIADYIKTAVVPIGVFLISLFGIVRFGAFGKNIIAPAIGLMWGLGAFVAWKIPSQRSSTLTQSYATVAGYVAGLLLFKVLIGIAVNTSSEQLMATYSQVMPVSTGSTISGFLQSMLWITAFMTPITACGAQAKKLITFRRTLSKNKVLEQIRGISEN